MSPDKWLASSALIKVRRKLPDWGRAHLLAFAEQNFKTTDLDKDQLNQLITLLKDPGVKKPLATASAASAVASATVIRDVVLAPNKGGLGTQTEYYMAGRHAGLRFATPQDLTGWAIGLLWAAKEPWHRVFTTWKNQQRLSEFKPTPGVPLSPDLQKVLARRKRTVERELMALPTRPTLRQAYWGFNVGDELRANLKELVQAHKPAEPRPVKASRVSPLAPARAFGHPRPDLVLKVIAVKPNTENAPVVTLEEQP